MAPELIAAWPRGDKVDSRRFELPGRLRFPLREELRWIEGRLALLQALVLEVPERRLAAGCS